MIGSLLLFVCVPSHLLEGFEAVTWPLAVQAWECQVFPCGRPKVRQGWRPRQGTWSPRSMSPPKTTNVGNHLYVRMDRLQGIKVGVLAKGRSRLILPQLCHERHQITQKVKPDVICQIMCVAYKLKLYCVWIETLSLTFPWTPKYSNFQRSFETGNLYA